MADGYQDALWLAARTALLADDALAELVGARIYDTPPQSVVFPYVRLGRMEFESDDTDGTLGAIVDFAIVVHTEPPQHGPDNSRIQHAIYKVLHRADERWHPDGYEMTSLEFLTSSTTRDGDHGRRVGRMAFQAKLQPNET
ncbi:DUF3168 domain-containing protein [Shimia thalassica]|uniref:DUF3168 domain-containing protein n=2 Tax=Shimia thalassica TaxID=1715693 RepID=UPI0026E1EB5B|nr:DUF3168 domain-containing protein [Shimia thalassica]MDO6799363.1 DUF3168 domain-containing protein [Shimia thalassica]MDP2495859.1 DUF3168 domain-containing protein [Shimia thalassica]